MTKELRRITVVVLAMFVALFVSTTLIGVVESDNLRADGRNTRVIYESYSAERGPILVDGTAIADSVPIDDEYMFQRRYLQPDVYSAITGYYTLNQGDSGIEGALNDYLSGTANDQFFGQLNAIFTGQDPQGASVELATDPIVQQAAWDALGTYNGSVVAIEPATGKILAMVSKPAYDPNVLASHDIDQVISSYGTLIDDAGRPLLNRAIGGDLYAPGSVFKVVVTAAAIDSGLYTADSEFPNPPTLQLPGSSTVITNAEGGSCGGTPTVSLATALRLSCNIPFAQLGAELGADVIGDYAERFGFERELLVPQPVTPSVYPRNTDAARLMLSSFGQDEVRVTPLQVAMFTAAIANGGELMEPTLVESISAPDLSPIEEFEETSLEQSVSPETAAVVSDLMVANVASGAANNARISGVDVAGKTGTAQNGGGRPDTLWFTGFAPAANPEVAIAVVVENGEGFGNSVAAPIAKRVVEAVLSR